MAGKALKFISWMCLVIILATTLQATEPQLKGKIDGTVTDPLYAAISKAIVIIHCAWLEPTDQRQSTRPEDFRLLSDRNGGFAIDLEPGFYDVAIFADGFSPYASKVRVKSGQATKYMIKLEVDPQESEEFGDRFSANPSPSDPITLPLKPLPAMKQ